MLLKNYNEGLAVLSLHVAKWFPTSPALLTVVLPGFLFGWAICDLKPMNPSDLVSPESLDR